MTGGTGDFDRAVEESILMEIQAMTLYTDLANRAEDEEAQRVLRFLADAEESHVARIVEIVPRFGGDGQAALAGVDVINAFRGDAWRMHRARLAGAGLTETSPADDYLTFAIVAETHARVHYEGLAAAAPEDRMKELFEELAREEAGHEENLRRIQRLLRSRKKG